MSSVRSILQFCVAIVLLYFGPGTKAVGASPQNTNNKTACTVQIGDSIDPIALTLSTLRQSEARIRVANQTFELHQIVRIRVTNFHLRDLTGNEVPNPILVEPSVGTLDPLESLIVLLRVDTKRAFSPGVYSATLTFDDVIKGTAEICKKNVQITVSSPKPFFSNQTVWVQRWLVFATVQNLRVSVPLTGYVSANTVLEPAIVARKDYGDFRRAVPRFSSAEPTNNVEYLIDELPHAGEYSGSLQVFPGDSGKVVLNIFVQDAIYWPVLISAIGVLIAMWSRTTALIGFNALRKMPKASEWAKSAVAFAIAIVVGLQRYYFGKPFGTSVDYASMFLVGAGAKISLDFLVATAGRLFLTEATD